MGSEDSGADNRWKPPSSSPPPPPPPDKADLKLWGILAFTVIGATATTFAVHQLRRTFDWVYTQVSSRKGTSSSFRSSFQEEAWRRYNKRMQEEFEEELERVERIRRMQSVFNRERNKFRRGFEDWKESDDPSAHQYHQQFQRHDWYWKTNQKKTNSSSSSSPKQESSRVYPLSHHYSVLGLSRSRGTPYTEAEIKKAFRVKAMEFHPDQNQDNKDVAEAKFKEVLFSYEAIKKERKDTDG